MQGGSAINSLRVFDPPPSEKEALAETGKFVGHSLQDVPQFL